MGVNPLPTGGIYKYFSFDGVTSASFGVHLTGTGVFNAPTRAIEMVNIPARNGAFPQDMGYFENIEVTYTASIVADNETDFADAVSDLRNWLCSRKGYCRLEDDYNPDEYRMAVYKSGLEVEPFRLEQGEFEIVFDCKPQRFLKSGETAISVTSGDTVTNPTPFSAGPLLEVEGYGNISFNGYNIQLFDDLVGGVMVARQKSANLPHVEDIGGIYVNPNDPITLHPSPYTGFTMSFGFEVLPNYSFTITSCTDSNIQASGLSDYLIGINNNGARVIISFQFNDLDFSALTSSSAFVSCDLSVVTSDSNSFTLHPKATVFYDDKGTISFNFSGINIPPQYQTIPANVNNLSVLIQSTATTYGHPTIIDCESGEAYTNKNNIAQSLGRYVALGAELPSLALGANTITFDNTITSVNLIPRWWQV